MFIKKIFASEHMTLDSDVLVGGGTDVTEDLQKLLNMAKDSEGIHIVLDGAALIRGLKVYSNTTIECPNKDCGFYLADFSNRPIIANANWDFMGEKPTRNVTIIGGTYNHNCTHQKHDIPYEDYPTPPTIGYNKDFATKHNIYLMEFYGIENLVIRDLTFRNQRTYTLTVGNGCGLYIKFICIWKDEIEGYKPVMNVEYKPIEYGKDYDIVNHPEMFELFIDGEKV